MGEDIRTRISFTLTATLHGTAAMSSSFLIVMGMESVVQQEMGRTQCTWTMHQLLLEENLLARVNHHTSVSVTMAVQIRPALHQNQPIIQQMTVQTMILASLFPSLLIHILVTLLGH